jgi:DNA-binding FadR family transcriptional regulator
MKKDDVLERLLRYIREQMLSKGDRLPAERQLAEILMSSRTTVREAIRRLEERGVLTIKRGSGVYVSRDSETIETDRRLMPPDEETAIRDQLEARFMIIPVVVRCAAARATGEEIVKLQDCIVRMSRAIVSRELEALADADTEFYHTIALMTKNYKLIETIRQLNTGNEIFWSYFMKSNEFVNNVIFAGYVEIANTVKRKDPQKAGEMAKQNIMSACEWLAKITRIDCAGIYGSAGDDGSASNNQ